MFIPIIYYRRKALEQVLFIQLRQLGDIILTTPCIRELKEAWPDTKISFLSHSMGRLVLEDCPWLDELYTYDPNGSKLAELELARKLRSKKFDCIIDFMDNPRSAIYTWFIGAPKRVGYTGRRDFVYNDKEFKVKTSDYIVQEKFKLLRRLGVHPQSEKLVLPWFEKHTEPLRYMLQANKQFKSGAVRVLMSPTHRRSVRQWPVERYAEIADRLSENWGACVVWGWGPGEEDFVNDVMSKCKSTTYKVPKTNFRELAAIIANCDLFIGNSNGPSHIAVAVDTPSLQIHGPTLAKSWSPKNARHQALQAGDLVDGGPISNITIDQTWNTLEIMKPVIKRNSDARHENSVRINWSL
tara:strand:- start:686 stop:1747 length:1062 start_codon:yes stop_codon:yes gene_type:complete